MNIYNELGYLDIPKIRGFGMPFNFITGARGTGKTFGALKDARDNNERFIFSRRTQTELETVIADPDLNPFNELNELYGWHVGFKKTGKYTWAIIDFDIETKTDEEGNERVEILTTGERLGLAVALTDIAKIRGFAALQYTLWIYDEFIPETHVRAIRDEHLAFMNAYETINRNRELPQQGGHKPLQVLALSNANRLDNALYMGLNLVTKVDRMKREHQMVAILQSRGVVLINMEDSPISDKKRDTALYRMAAGTGYEAMALDNKYIGEDDRHNIRSRPLAEFKPVVSIGEICVYRHKSKGDTYHISAHVTGSPDHYGMSEIERARFKRTYGWLWVAYLDDRVTCESRICEILLTNVFQ